MDLEGLLRPTLVKEVEGLVGAVEARTVARAEAPSKPTEVLRREIVETLRLMRDLRSTVGEQLKEVKRELKLEGDQMKAADRLAVMGKLAEVMQTVGRAIGEAAKNLPEKEAREVEGMDVERMLEREVLGGRRS